MGRHFFLPEGGERPWRRILAAYAFGEAPARCRVVAEFGAFVTVAQLEQLADRCDADPRLMAANRRKETA